MVAIQLLIGPRCGAHRSHAEGQAQGMSPAVRIPSIHLFLHKTSKSLDAVRADLARMRGKFQDVLRYFGEDPELTPMAFFTTLGSFLKVSSALMVPPVAHRRQLLPPHVSINHFCGSCYLRSLTKPRRMWLAWRSRRSGRGSWLRGRP